MTSKKNRHKKQANRKSPKPEFKRPNKLATMSRLSLALYFFIPLIFGEILLYFGGRTISMGLLFLAWLGFWAALLSTSNWAPLIRCQEQADDNQ